MNWPLFSVVFTIALTVVIGVLMIAALVMGFNQILHIQIVIGFGLIICLPISWYFAKRLGSITGNEEGYKV
jgi:preprotein translocase subunit SecF